MRACRCDSTLNPLEPMKPTKHPHLFGLVFRLHYVKTRFTVECADNSGDFYLSFPGFEIRVLRIPWGLWPAKICLAHLNLLSSIKLKHIGTKNSLTFDLLGTMDESNGCP